MLNLKIWMVTIPLMLIILLIPTSAASQDSVSTGVAVQFDSSINMWRIGVPGAFEADCVLPQYSYQEAYQEMFSVFMNCEEITNLVFRAAYRPPTKYNTTSPCFDLFTTLSLTSYVESQLLCGDPYADNVLVWQDKAILVKPSIFTTTLFFRVLYIKRMQSNFAVHVKVFSVQPHSVSKLPTVMASNFVIENYCVKEGFKAVKHGLLQVYNYYESLSSCNVYCAHGFIREPWLSTAMPKLELNTTNQSQVEERTVTCRKIEPPLDAVLTSAQLVVPITYQMPHNLPDGFFDSVNGLNTGMQAWFLDTQAQPVTTIINVKGTRFADVPLKTIMNQIMSKADSADLEVITNNNPSRRLLEAYAELDTEMLFIFTKTNSPSHITKMVRALDDEFLRHHTSPYVDSVQNVQLETMFHIPAPSEPKPDRSFNLFFVIGMGVFVVVVVVLVIVLGRTGGKNK